MYAIVDIETTGSYAANNGITELAIVLYDGKKIVDRYETLIDPQSPIPQYVQVLTGIHPEMLKGAPVFSEVAQHVYDMLKDAIFVAHHVNFDYSFIKYHLESCGYELDVKKLCTVRLSRKVFPGLSGYSLGKLCRELAIPILNRHRAGGYAVSAEVRMNGELVGGLYGVRLGKIFYGESMFSRHSNASKFAFISYVDQLKSEGVELIDCQVYTSHLQSLGARMIPRNQFIKLVKKLVKPNA